MLYESSDVFNKKLPHLSFLETSKSSIDRPFFIAMLVDCCNNLPKPASISVANLLKNIQGTTIFTTMISSPLGLVNASCSSPLLCCHSAWPTKTSQFFCCRVTPTTKQVGLLFRGDPAKNYQQDLYDVGFPQNGSHLMIPACSEILKFGSLRRRSWSLDRHFSGISQPKVTLQCHQTLYLLNKNATAWLCKLSPHHAPGKQQQRTMRTAFKSHLQWDLNQRSTLIGTQMFFLQTATQFLTKIPHLGNFINAETFCHKSHSLAGGKGGPHVPPLVPKENQRQKMLFQYMLVLRRVLFEGSRFFKLVKNPAIPPTWKTIKNGQSREREFLFVLSSISLKTMMVQLH